MINFLFHILISLSYLFNPIERTSWINESNGINQVRIYSDNYFVVSNYNINNKKFISTKGGFYSFKNSKYYEVLEFNSLDSSLVGDTIFYSDIKIDLDEENNLITGIRIGEVEYIPNQPNHVHEYDLHGSWLMSGIERRGEMRMRDINRPRKTMKILAGGRFQWIAYDTSKKGFYGTGGGTFTAKDGKYIENIEFFSRDSNTVGNSLEFDFEIKEEDWHHRGFSSKGDPKYEIWTQRKQ